MNKHLKTLLTNEANGTVASADFTKETQKEATTAAILTAAGLSPEATYRQIRDNQRAIFSIIEVILEEVVPQKVQDILGSLAQVETFARDAEVKYTIPTSYASKRRMATAIKKGARGGIYQALRIDGRDLVVETATYTVAAFITLEEILLGTRTLAELTSLIADAWVEKIYIEVVNQLQAAATAAPNANKVTLADADLTDPVSARAINGVIATIGSYGTPVIMGFPRALSTLTNGVGNNYSQADLNDIRTRGHVGTLYGAQVVQLPNFIVNPKTNQWLFEEKDILVIPADHKPVKIGFRGEQVITEVTHPSGSKEINSHRIMGMALLFNNAIGTITISDM